MIYLKNDHMQQLLSYSYSKYHCSYYTYTVSRKYVRYKTYLSCIFFFFLVILTICKLVGYSLVRYLLFKIVLVNLRAQIQKKGGSFEMFSRLIL
jgi:hypothetical protein